MPTPPAAGRDRIFISYRREDARGASGRVWDWLRIGFGRERVFRDVASIGAAKWRQAIEQALAASRVCVAVMGRRWADDTNLSRLREPNDQVRHELELALARADREQLTVIPLLVEDAQLDQIPLDHLPESLRPLLTEWNVLVLSESGWDDDTRRLIMAIASATGLPVNPELEDWLALVAGARQRLAGTRGVEAAGVLGRQGVEQAVEDLLHHAAGADPGGRPPLKVALEALARGDTLLAEDAFEEEFAKRRHGRLQAIRLRKAVERMEEREGHREAAAARHVASLAVARGDLTKAVRYFQLALEADPDDLEAALQLGHAWISRGDLALASLTFEGVIQQARAAGDPRQEARGLTGSGDVLKARGDGPGALAAYQAGRAIREGLAKRDPTNTQWQRDLSVSQERIGDGWLARGNGPEALAAHRAALAIAQDLVRRDPANTQWQQDLAVGHTKIGDVLVAQGDRPGALVAYRAALTIAADLVKRDPGNTQWQRNLSVSHGRIGDGLVAQGDGPGALVAYQAALAIAQDLVRRDPTNTQWQRDLSVSHERIGDGRLARGDGPEALAAYQAGLAIREDLAKRDPTNTLWQRDLLVSHGRIGDGLMAQGDGPGALEAYQVALVLAEDLAKRDPTNTQWQQDLSMSHDKIGNVLLAEGDGLGALAAYQASLAIAEELAKRDQTNTDWQRGLSVSHNKMGDLLLAQGDGPGALAAYQADLAIAEDLAKRDPTNTGWQRDLSVSLNAIGDARLAQGDGPGALAAYQAGLAIVEDLAKHDPTNTQWQVDRAVSCAKLGSLESQLSIHERRIVLRRGLKLLMELKHADKLNSNQDWTTQFEEALNDLP